MYFPYFHLYHRDIEAISHKSFCNRHFIIQGIILGQSESKKVVWNLTSILKNLSMNYAYTKRYDKSFENKRITTTYVQPIPLTAKSGKEEKCSFDLPSIPHREEFCTMSIDLL